MKTIRELEIEHWASLFQQIREPMFSEVEMSNDCMLEKIWRGVQKNIEANVSDTIEESVCRGVRIHTRLKLRQISS